MFANDAYDPISLARFQLSLLSLEAALDRSAPIGPKEISGALAEADRLKQLIEDHDRK